MISKRTYHARSELYSISNRIVSVISGLINFSFSASSSCIRDNIIKRANKRKMIYWDLENNKRRKCDITSEGSDFSAEGVC